VFTALPLLFCFGLAFKRAIARCALVLGGIGLLLRLIRPLSARRA
jgi:hypothetical protein